MCADFKRFAAKYQIALFGAAFMLFGLVTLGVSIAALRSDLKRHRKYAMP